MQKRWLVKRRQLVVLEATTYTRIYGQQQLGKCWCVARSQPTRKNFRCKVYSCKIFSYVFCVRKYLCNEQKAKYGITFGLLPMANCMRAGFTMHSIFNRGPASRKALTSPPSIVEWKETSCSGSSGVVINTVRWPRSATSDIRHPSSVIRHLSSVICHPSSRF